MHSSCLKPQRGPQESFTEPFHGIFETVAPGEVSFTVSHLVS